MLVLGVVAAPDVTAGETQPEMHPAVARPQTFLAAVRARLHRTNLIEVLARVHCCSSAVLDILVRRQRATRVAETLSKPALLPTENPMPNALPRELVVMLSAPS